MPIKDPRHTVTTPSNEQAAGLSELGIFKVLDAIGSEEPSSGAGIAAAIALALSTACALKALNVTRKHRETEDLCRRIDALIGHRNSALEHARVESELFGKFLQGRAPEHAALLIQAANDFQSLARHIATEIEGLEGEVLSSVSDDVTAARTLHAAAVSIEGLIMRSNRDILARTVK